MGRGSVGILFSRCCSSVAFLVLVSAFYLAK